MKKNTCYYMLLAASTLGHELTAEERKMLAKYMRG